ncbi:Uncharacterised protein [Klebsiella pneumoniae]|nr:Uncharacterised protein [Klebsiella pneumoniae]SSH30200.1 Uncharacterised protein [Klebsiella pneumoniae]SYR55533.1 Uncharacterised protein [Klebsiella pneumoniae]
MAVRGTGSGSPSTTVIQEHHVIGETVKLITANNADTSGEVAVIINRCRCGMNPQKRRDFDGFFIHIKIRHTFRVGVWWDSYLSIHAARNVATGNYFVNLILNNHIQAVGKVI